MAYDWLTATQTPDYGYYPGYGNTGTGYGGSLPWQQAQPQNPLSGLLKSFAGARYNMQGTNLAPIQGLAGEIQRLSHAQYDPNDPLFQQTVQGETEAGKQDLAASIAEMVRQNRKLSSMGRTPLFNAERGGETVFRGLTQGYQDVQNNARTRAREILQGGQNAATGALTAQSALTQLQDANKKKQAFGIGNIADAFPFLGKMF